MAIIPNISSDIAGPLGAIHLPRLWSKLRLSAAGQLEDGYPECGAGFDQMVLDGLGVDRDAAGAPCVTRVAEDGQAAKAGVRVGDVVIALNGTSAPAYEAVVRDLPALPRRLNLTSRACWQGRRQARESDALPFV